MLNRYPYPLFDMVSTPQRGGIFMISAILFTGSAILLKLTYERVNGRVGDGVQNREKEAARPGQVN